MGQAAKKIELFVPGRLCLFGEHSDWAGSYRRINSEICQGSAIVIGLEQGIRATAERSNILRVRTRVPGSNQSETFESIMDIKALKNLASKGGFFSYIAGVAAYLLEHHEIGGVEIDCFDMTLPIKRGLSSSAAICVLTARAFNRLYSLQLTVRGEMEAAYKGEILTPSRCGRMDQACAYGNKPINMVFDGDELEIERMKVGKELYWVFADLKAQKDTKKILSDLNKSFPFARDSKDMDIQEALGKENWQIVENVKKAFETGDAERIGALMYEAQELFDRKVAPGCAEELCAKKLHMVLEDVKTTGLVWGGKGVGSQGDGTIQFITKGKAEQEELIQYLNQQLGLEAYALTIPAQRSVTKAVVPLAGYGTRLFPATRAIKKELFPIIDKDGIAKPALLILLEELDGAGIDEICLIIRDGEEGIYRNLFEQELEGSYYEKLSPEMKKYDAKIRRLGQKIKFITQREQLGFGHAVYQSRDFAGGEPVLLVLGDHIYQSDYYKSCASQAIDAYELSGQLTILIDSVKLSSVSHYGIVSGKWEDSKERLLSVSSICEKPSKEYAKEHLGVRMRNGETCYFSVFGQYILTPRVYELLERNISEKRLERGEYQLTSVLEDIRKEEGMYALVPEGKRFDIGIPEAYKSTVYSFPEYNKEAL